VTPDEMKAIVEEAHSSGVRVAAHATGDNAARVAAEAGVDSIEHAYTVSDDVLKMMVQKHIFLVPTDHTAQVYFDMQCGARQPAPTERQEIEDRLKSVVAHHGERLQRAIKIGVPIAAGSDHYVKLPQKNRGQGSLDTLAAYAEEGMTPMEIIQASTRNAAELLGMRDHIGTLEAGKLADIIAVLGDPLKDIKLGRVHTTRRASTMSAKERNARKTTSSFSKREKIRRKPLSLRNSRSISLRFL
jgi:imidazolonepropionase-like amidohydrolase